MKGLCPRKSRRFSPRKKNKEESVDNLRVYDDVEETPEPVVYIRAVGIKERNRVRIGKEVIVL